MKSPIAVLGNWKLFIVFFTLYLVFLYRLVSIEGGEAVFNAKQHVSYRVISSNSTRLLICDLSDGLWKMLMSSLSLSDSKEGKSIRLHDIHFSREIYKRVYTGFYDILFPAFSALSYSSLLSILFPDTLIDLFPILSFICDMIENYCVYTLLQHYPITKGMRIYAHIGSAMTSLKFISFIATMVLITIGFVKYGLEFTAEKVEKVVQIAEEKKTISTGAIPAPETEKEVTLKKTE